MDAFEIIKLTMDEFAEVPEDTVRAYISIVEPLVSKKRFGGLYQQALAYLAAHKMKMSNVGTINSFGGIGNTIGIASISEGETSVSFCNSQSGNTSADSEYGMTVYGVQYLQIRNRCIMAIVSAGEGGCHGCQCIGQDDC